MRGRSLHLLLDRLLCRGLLLDRPLLLDRLELVSINLFAPPRQDEFWSYDRGFIEAVKEPPANAGALPSPGPSSLPGSWPYQMGYYTPPPTPSGRFSWTVFSPERFSWTVFSFEVVAVPDGVPSVLRHLKL